VTNAHSTHAGKPLPYIVAHSTRPAEPIYGSEAHSAAMQQFLGSFPDMQLNTPHPIQSASSVEPASYVPEVGTEPQPW
jgi:hypothetical protein